MGFNATAFDGYYRTPLGQLTKRFVQAQLAALWPNMNNMRLLGIGYPHQYMADYQAQAERALILLPQSRERVAWPLPELDKNTLCIAPPGMQPFPAESFDRLLVVHCLEFLDQTPQILDEFYRVMKPHGRMILIVPNRLSSWARQETTPFGYGAPYTLKQISRYISESRLSIVNVRRALFAPPFETEFCQRMAPAFEGIGQAAFKSFCGVHILEVIKTVPAPVRPQKGTPVISGILKPQIGTQTA